MHCPECHSLNEAGSAACATCGLLLIDALPKRRLDDQAQQKRRAADRELSRCQYCQGEIPQSAIRCKHCSEIVNEDFYRERMQRTRARINYASWVAYLFGLGALLLFRPVGLLSIAAGLILSILYYAIPVEPPTKRSGAPNKGPRWKFTLERVAIPIPAMRNRKLIFVGTPLIAALVGYSANLLILQEPVNDILKENAAFNGMKVSAHYQYWVVPGVVVYDLESLTVRQTPIDVHTAFLEFARRMKEKKLERVELSYQGVTKFSIDGDQFRRLGVEYAKRNFDFALYSFPKLFHAVGGNVAPTPTGADTERDALLQFHKQWYGQDSMTRTVANGL